MPSLSLSDKINRRNLHAQLTAEVKIRKSDRMIQCRDADGRLFSISLPQASRCEREAIRAEYGHEYKISPEAILMSSKDSKGEIWVCSCVDGKALGTATVRTIEPQETIRRAGE